MSELAYSCLYQPGDVVRVREDLVSSENMCDNRIYYAMFDDPKNRCIVNDDMLKFCGQSVTIKGVDNVFGVKYRILDDGCSWAWTDEMFSGLYEPQEVPAFEPEDIDILFN